MDARTPVSVAPACSEPERVRFYERLGRYFDWLDVPNAPEVKVGRCERCGAEGMRIVDIEQTGSGKCVAQHALTSKRWSSDKGQPLAYGVKLHEGGKRGYFSIASDKSYCLVGPRATLYVGTVVPSAPLPEWLEARHQFGGPRFTDLLKLCIDAGPDDHPYILADFTKKGDIPLVETTDPGRIVVNGKASPASLEKARLVEILALIRDFGEARVKDAMKLKEQLGRGDRDGRKSWLAMRGKVPELMLRFHEVPSKDEPERAYAFAIAEAEAKAERARKPTTETATGDNPEVTA